MPDTLHIQVLWRTPSTLGLLQRTDHYRRQVLLVPLGSYAAKSWLAWKGLCYQASNDLATGCSISIYRVNKTAQQRRDSPKLIFGYSAVSPLEMVQRGQKSLLGSENQLVNATGLGLVMSMCPVRVKKIESPQLRW